MELDFYRQAIEKSPSIVVITNINGEFVYVNPKFTEITGYTLNDVVGKKTSLLKSGELSTEYYKKMWDNLLQGKEWKGEFHNKKKNGQLYWISSSISSIKDSNGNIYRFVAVQEDITRIKIAQQQIDELNTFQKLILSTIPNGIVTFDKTGKILFVNPSMEKLTLFNKFELHNNNFMELVDSAGLISLIMGAFKNSEKPPVETELNLIPKRGEPFPVEVIISELTSQEKYLAVVRDLRIEKMNEEIMEEFQKLLINDTYLTIFRQSNTGPTVYLTNEFTFSKTEKNILSTKIGVYYSTAIGQGGTASSGLYGPLPFPDSTEYESLVYTCFLNDSQNKDPRAKGKSYCMFVVTFPIKYEPYYTNRNFLRSILDNFIQKHQSLQSISKVELDELKSNLIK